MRESFRSKMGETSKSIPFEETILPAGEIVLSASLLELAAHWIIPKLPTDSILLYSLEKWSLSICFSDFFSAFLEESFSVVMLEPFLLILESSLLIFLEECLLLSRILVEECTVGKSDLFILLARTEGRDFLHADDLDADG